MGLLDSLLTGGTANAVSSVANLGNTILDRVIPDPAQANAAKQEWAKIAYSGDAAQMAVNLADANSGSFFRAGWRPALGWVCVLACAWNWVFMSLTKFFFLLFGLNINVQPASLTEMLPILIGMLGLGGYRTVERLNGKA